jgi:TPR repeat protein
LLRRADTLLHSADFESARLIYAALADNGIAQAAVLMAQTYDPEVLKKRFVVGMSPDIDKAMEWYRRAIELGESGARRRLDILAVQR